MTFKPVVIEKVDEIRGAFFSGRRDVYMTDASTLAVRRSLDAMIEAEEHGITQFKVNERLKSENPAIKRILGVTPGMGMALRVDERWVYDIVTQVGNYGESFERNGGRGSRSRSSPAWTCRGPKVACSTPRPSVDWHLAC